MKIAIKKVSRYLAPLILLLALNSCDSNIMYEENVNIPDYSWDKDFRATFDVEMEDTTQLYDVYFNVRHTNHYPFSNLNLVLHTVFPDGNRTESKVELLLADKDGKWFGDCAGDICDYNELKYMAKTRFPQKGTYKFELQQFTRYADDAHIDKLPGIMSMGIRIEKHTSSNEE